MYQFDIDLQKKPKKMRNKVLIISMLLTTFFLSCKDEKKTESNTAVKENFSVELDVIASKKDDFALYYTEDNTINFIGEKALWSGVKGGNVQEIIKFDLSEELVPTDIRLDFGLNKEQDLIELFSVKIVYYGREFIIKGSDFFTYFIEQDAFTTEIDPAKGSIKFIIPKGNHQTPFYYPRQELLDAIKKLTSEQES